MNKPTILFLAFNAHGHVNPLMGVADQVKGNNDYRTIFLLSEPSLGSKIRKHGHEFVALKPAANENSGQKEEEVETNPQKFANLSEGNQTNLDSVDNFIHTFNKILNICVTSSVANNDLYAAAIEKINPDLIVVDGAILTPYMYNCGRPWVRLYVSNPLLFCQSRLPGRESVPPMVGCSLLKGKAAREKMRNQDPAGWQALISHWNADYRRMRDAKIGLLSDFQKTFIANSLKPFDFFERDYDSPHLNMYQFPRDLDYDLEDDILCYPPGFIGFDTLVCKSLDRVNPEEAQDWVEKLKKGMVGKSAMLYFSLGTLASANLKLMNRWIDILKEDKKRLYVVSKGELGDQIELCEDNMIGANYVPQTLILKHADLAIMHGGHNTVSECLQHGVPMIALPVFADQLDNAQRLEDLEIGRRLDVDSCTREQVMTAINEVLGDSKLLERVKKIGERMRVRDDNHKISLVFKKLLEEGHLDQNFLNECREKTAKEVEIICRQTNKSNSE